jgi:signal transduction histidine kinase
VDLFARARASSALYCDEYFITNYARKALAQLGPMMQGVVPTPPARKSRWTFAARPAIVIAALNLLLIWGTAVGLVWIRYHEEIESWKRIAFATSVNTAAYVNQALTTADLVLKSMQDWIGEEQFTSESQFRQVMSERRFHDALRDRIGGAPQISVAAIADSNGDLLSSTSAYPVPKLNIGHRATFSALSGPNPPDVALGTLVRSAGEGRWTFFLSRRVTSETGEFLGVLRVGFDAEYFSKLFNEVTLASQNTISLFRTDGVLLATTIHNPALLGNRYEQALPIRMIEEGRSGSVVMMGGPKWFDLTDSRERIMAPRLVDRYPVLVSITIGEQVYLADWWNETYIILVGALILTALTVYIAVRYLDIASRAEKADRMAAERRLLATLLDTPSALCAVLDRQGRLLYSNDRFAALLTRDRDPFTVLDDPALRGVDALRHFAADSEEGTIELDLRLEPPSKPARFLHFSASRQSLPDLGQCVILVGHDETDRHQAQLAIAQAAKMVTLGEMTTGMAHELSQPLNVIRMAAQNALVEAIPEVTEPDADAEFAPLSDAEFRSVAADKLGRIMLQVDRAAEIISRMRIFGRASGGPASTFDAREACHSAIALVGGRIRSMGMALREDLGQEELLLRGHQSLLEQVLVNLLLNARDALNDSQRTDKAIDVTAERGANGRIVIRVSDNGPGVPADIRDRIFEPFFTAKPASQGTGLGLALSFGIVRDAGGTLSLLPDMPGAVFQIDLPATAVSATPL